MADIMTKAQAAVGTCGAVAILTTLHRIFARARRGRLWLDDMWATFSMCSVIVQLVSMFMKSNSGNKVTRFYLLSTTFYAIIWSARLSILFSIIRIDIKPQRQRILVLAAVLFFFIWLLLTAQIFWECESNTSWKQPQSVFPRCNLSPAVGFFQLISDIISDSILLFVPIRLFMLIRDKGLRYRLMVIFGTCVITTVVSFVHTAYMLEAQVFPIIISSSVENTISLVVCNIPTMVTSMFDLRHRDTLPSSPDEMPTLRMLVTMTRPPAATSSALSCSNKPETSTS